MTYVTDQTPSQLRSHMRMLVRLPGWHEPLADRLWKEIQEQEAELRRLHAALQTIEQWNSHPVDLSLDYGSNGVRDFYRGIARAAITKATGEQS